MIVAMLALFVALTGTAVATTSTLITGKSIKNGSITGLDVKNKSLTSKDIKGQLRGPRGLTGAPGATGAAGAKGDKGDKGDPGTPGAPGEPATRLWAAVDSDGSLVRGSGAVSSGHAGGGAGSGFYEVIFKPQRSRLRVYRNPRQHRSGGEPCTGRDWRS